MLDFGVRERVPVLLMSRDLGLGGSERQAAETARGLGGCGFEAHVGCLSPPGARAGDLRAAGVPVTCFHVYSFGSAGAVAGARRLAAYIREHGMRLVHAFDWPTTAYAVPVIRALTSAMVLSSQRSHRHLTPPAWRHVVRITDRMVDGIVVNCDFVRRHMVEDEKVPAALVHVCHNGIDLDTFHPAAAPRPAGLEDATAVVGVVCGLRPEKDLKTLIAAFARIHPAHPGVKLVLVGDGACFADLRAQADESGAASACMFVPGTPDVAGWMRAIDIFVLPSLSEALSNSLMEAMACGCCAVASRIGGNPELVAHEETGALFACGDVAELAAVLDRLLRDHCRRKQLAAAGTRFIQERFSLPASASRMAAIYSALLARR